MTTLYYACRTVQTVFINKRTADIDPGFRRRLSLFNQSELEVSPDQPLQTSKHYTPSRSRIGLQVWNIPELNDIDVCLSPKVFARNQSRSRMHGIWIEWRACTPRDWSMQLHKYPKIRICAKHIISEGIRSIPMISILMLGIRSEVERWTSRWLYSRLWFRSMNPTLFNYDSAE